jgi:hypothetical protein
VEEKEWGKQKPKMEAESVLTNDEILEVLSKYVDTNVSLEEKKKIIDDFLEYVYLGDFSYTLTELNIKSEAVEWASGLG